MEHCVRVVSTLGDCALQVAQGSCCKVWVLHVINVFQGLGLKGEAPGQLFCLVMTMEGLFWDKTQAKQAPIDYLSSSFWLLRIAKAPWRLAKISMSSCSWHSNDSNTLSGDELHEGAILGPRKNLR